MEHMMLVFRFVNNLLHSFTVPGSNNCNGGARANGFEPTE